MFLCLGCGGSLKTGSARKFCNNACQVSYRSKTYIERWLAGLETGTTKHSTSNFVKRFLRQKQKGACADCSRKNWRGQPIHLEVEHDDGNWQNNAPSNVRMICANCHTQTTTYKAKNKGNGFGREWRQGYQRRWQE